ncbi:hypothetical protein F5X68DRAFT_250202 [Plectosphaerella plurivora]|uniref:CFEM domain-containing protein n=1 Tax=Plectosphaerella plurivora TaxID=936078 RepID=A0A9P8V1C7_9PEZI|nr:hypothetical protein F5X68DRAFT_250202 [Plectosphaerella plurivora]
MFTKTAILALFAGLVAAQDITLIPDCSRSCFIENIPTSGCTGIDFVCLCGSESYTPAVIACTVAACSEEDQAATLEWAVATCEAVGVPINP